MIGRRVFLLGGTGALLLPAAVRAQQADKVWRIGIIARFPRDSSKNLRAFFERLHELGYIEGKTLVIDYVPRDVPQFPGLARALVQRGANVIFAPTADAAYAARSATTSIPIVFATMGDPVAMHFAASLAHPGGNATGLTTVTTELSGKRLELLREVLPGLQRVAVLFDSLAPNTRVALQETERAARALDIETLPVRIENRDQIDRAMAAAWTGKAEAVVVLGGAITQYDAVRVASLALEYRFPSIYVQRDAVDAGGLISYGPNYTDNFRRAADLVDKILKGAKPGDLPIERPTKIELLVNLKTARALGITVPESILLRADEVIR